MPREPIGGHFIAYAGKESGANHVGPRGCVMKCNCGVRYVGPSWAEALYQLELHFAQTDAASIIKDGDFVYVVDEKSERFDNFGQVVVCGMHSMFVRFLDSAPEGIYLRHVQVAKVHSDGPLESIVDTMGPRKSVRSAAE